jgi:PD-(D/E)XK endonuclease
MPFDTQIPDRLYDWSGISFMRKKLEIAYMGNTSKTGLIGQTAILNRLVQLGHEVLLPWSPDLGYDLAYYVETEERHFGFFVHKESQLVRIQCKVAWLSSDKGSLRFNTSTVSMGGAGVWKKKKSGYRGRADWFGVYSPDTGKVYMISVWEAPDASNMNLRLLPPKNNQEKNVHWARDYDCNLSRVRHQAQSRTD